MTRLNLRNLVWDPYVYPNISSRIDTNAIMNEAVRHVLADCDMRSTKRMVGVSPRLFDRINDIPKPTDMKEAKICDLDPQYGNRRVEDAWWLTTAEEFARRANTERMVLAVDERDNVGKIRVSIDNDLDQLMIASLGSLTGDGGTWEAFSADTENVATDTDDFVQGNGSISFDINAAGGTTAGIKNDSLTEYDYDDYVEQNRSVFVFFYLTSPTNITNIKLRLGQTATYDTMTVTTQADGTAFQTGINLLRFDLSGRVTTGNPDRTVGTYVAIYMTKAVGKISETGYWVNYLVAQEGKYYTLSYYSKYGWQTNAGVWILDSTDDSDILNADDPDEMNLITEQCRIRKALLEKDYQLAEIERQKYYGIQSRYVHMPGMLDHYVMSYPSEALPLTTIYHET